MAGKLLRGFRTFLTSHFLKDDEGNFVDGEFPSKYPSLISKQEWETFKSKRQTPEFKSLSAINWERASAPPYPYKKGRMGYARLQQSIVSIYKLQ